MAELSTTKLDHDSHLLLDQPLLRLPSELLRKNFKSAQRQVEITNKNVTSAIQASTNQSPADTLASLDATLAKAQGLKRKLEALQTEEKVLHRQQQARLNHLQELHEIPSLADVKYSKWSHTRLDRLLVDYLLRQGYAESAKELAREKDIEELVDCSVFDECRKIEKSLREGKMQDCLTWCADNKQALKKIDSTLELELRLQQFIQLARSTDPKQRLEAMMYARKHLSVAQDTEFALKAAGLLANPPDTPVEPYKTMFSSSRYDHLTKLFIDTHHALFALPSHSLLHTALSAGLSALKTPACHSVHAPTPSAFTGAPVCPICSTELNELARNVPYAHHTKSHIEDDPVVLENGRLFGRERFTALMSKMGVPDGEYRDPTEKNGVTYRMGGQFPKKVYIS